MDISTAKKILKIDEALTIENVKSSYRKLSSIHHPDKGGNHDNFVLIKQAYDRLLSAIDSGDDVATTDIDDIHVIKAPMKLSELYNGNESIYTYKSMRFSVTVPQYTSPNTIIKTDNPNIYVKAMLDDDTIEVDENGNIFKTYHVTTLDLIIGKDIRVEFADGKPYTLSIPPNTKDGTRFKTDKHGFTTLSKFYIVVVGYQAYYDDETLEKIRSVIK